MITVLTAAVVGLVVSILGTPAAIRALARRGYGQPIQDELPTSHHAKRGTPTMGGIVIILAALVGYTAAHLIRPSEPSVSALLVLGLMVGLGLVGFLDDYLKIFKQRSLGLRSRAKLAGQVVVALAFALLAIRFENDQSLTPASQAVSFLRDTPLVLPVVLFVVWTLLIVSSTSNAVNLTDGNSASRSAYSACRSAVRSRSAQALRPLADAYTHRQGAAERFFLLIESLTNPMIAVATNRTTPTTPSHRMPSSAKPMMAKMSQTARRMITRVNILRCYARSPPPVSP